MRLANPARPGLADGTILFFRLRMGYLLITNDIEPYYRDVVYIMAQRYGCIYRFRYERESGFDLIDLPKPAAMEHQHAVIVLRSRETGRFVPIRRARVEHVFDSRRLVVVRFALLDFPDPTSRSNWHIISEIIESQSAKNESGKPLHPLVFEASDSDIGSIVGSPVSDSERSGIVDVDRWRYVIDSISELEFAKKSCFLYLHSIYEDDGAPLPRNRVKGGSFLAAPDSAYRFEIASYHSSTMAKQSDQRDTLLEFSLVLKTDAAILSPIQESSTVYSRYDDHLVSFRTNLEFPAIAEGDVPDLRLRPLCSSCRLAHTVDSLH